MILLLENKGQPGFGENATNTSSPNALLINVVLTWFVSVILACGLAFLCAETISACVDRGNRGSNDQNNMFYYICIRFNGSTPAIV